MALSIGMIGYGAIGRCVHGILATLPKCRLATILVKDSVVDGEGVPVVRDPQAFLRGRHDVVIECAGQAALRQHAVSVLESGANLVVASVGALVDDEFRNKLAEAAAQSGAAVRIPSGAIAGIDGLAAARLVGLEHVTYRGTMPPHALRNFESQTPVAERTLVYEGTARDAVARFPKNANLTGTIALGGLGFDRTRVEIVLDPEAGANLHELEASGGFGHFRVSVSGNRISAASPSSRIVPGSLVQAALGSNYLALPTPVDSSTGPRPTT